MRVLAIDPGYERCGVAVLEYGRTQKEKLLYSECIQTPAALPFPERLHHIGNTVTSLIAKWSPDSMALETLFFNTNQKTAMHVAEVRGMLLYIAATHTLGVHEYTPPQIKTAVGAGGKATKRDVIHMVCTLVDMPKNGLQKRLDDEYDAVAVALTHSAIQR